MISGKQLKTMREGALERRALSCADIGKVHTLTTTNINLLMPDPDDIDIADIAWGLGRIPRFNGHMRADYSVAHHSVVMSYLVPKRFAKEALLHDAAEAYMGDIITPVKNLFPEVRKVEKHLLAAIMRKFEVDVDILPDRQGLDECRLHEEVALLDFMLYEAECHEFGRPEGYSHPDIDRIWIEAALAHDDFWYAGQYAFMQRYDQLWGTTSFDKDTGLMSKELSDKWFPPTEEKEDAEAKEV